MNLAIVILLGLFTLVSCGKETQSISLNAKDGSSCSVSEARNDLDTLVIGARITCTDGSSTLVLNGADGVGVQGIQGEPGNSCSITKNPGESFSTITCPGSTPVIVTDGTNGVTSGGCLLERAPNQPGNGNKYRLTCGTVSITFTAQLN